MNILPATVKPVNPGSLGVTVFKVITPFSVGESITMFVFVIPSQMVDALLVTVNEGVGLTVTTVIWGPLEGQPGATAINVYSIVSILSVGLIKRSVMIAPSTNEVVIGEKPVIGPALIPVIVTNAPATGVFNNIEVCSPEQILSVGAGLSIVNVGVGFTVTIAVSVKGFVQLAACTEKVYVMLWGFTSAFNNPSARV